MKTATLQLQLQEQDAQAVRAALQRCAQGGIDLPDGLIAAQHQVGVLTFDAQAVKSLDMELLR